MSLPKEALEEARLYWEKHPPRPLTEDQKHALLVLFGPLKIIRKKRAS